MMLWGAVSQIIDSFFYIPTEEVTKVYIFISWISCIFSFICAIGLFSLKEWARKTTIIYTAFETIVYGYFHAGENIALVTLISVVYIIVLAYFLTRPKVIMVFKNSKKIKELFTKKRILIFIILVLVDIGLTSFFNKPLHNSVRNGDIDRIEKLLNIGMDVNLKDYEGKTPLHTAVEARNIGIMELLLANGAHVDAKDNNGNTPLKLAVFLDYTEIADFLIKKWDANLIVIKMIPNRRFITHRISFFNARVIENISQ